jgi:hypothetical protein
MRALNTNARDRDRNALARDQAAVAEEVRVSVILRDRRVGGQAHDGAEKAALISRKAAAHAFLRRTRVPLIKPLLAPQAHERCAIGGGIAASGHGARELRGGGGIELIAPDRFRTGDFAQWPVAQHGEERWRFAELDGIAVDPQA